MLGFHSQNVLQILENMKPIIFRISVTDEGEITFNRVEGMTNSQAYELMLRDDYGKEGDEPIIPIIRVSYKERAGYDYTMDFIATPVITFSSGTKPLTFTLAVPAIPRKVSAMLEFDAALYGRGKAADNNVFIGLVINANGNISVKYFEN